MELVVLSELEQAQLDKLERVIERNITAFYEIGTALLTIRDKRLYREKYGTFQVQINGGGMNLATATNPAWEEGSFCETIDFYGLEVEVIGTWHRCENIARYIEIDSAVVQSNPPTDLSKLIGASEELWMELEKLTEKKMEG